jgi:hypothetical protein
MNQYTNITFLPRSIIFVYCIETGTSGGTAVLRILGEYHCTLHPISKNTNKIYQSLKQKEVVKQYIIPNITHSKRKHVTSCNSIKE